MRALATIALLLPCFCGAQGLAQPRVQTGTVTTLDRVGMSFTCEASARSRTYWVTRATRFRLGTADASLFEMRTGESAQVMFHRSGDRNVADLVMLGE